MESHLKRCEGGDGQQSSSGFEETRIMEIWGLGSNTGNRRKKL